MGRFKDNQKLRFRFRSITGQILPLPFNIESTVAAFTDILTSWIPHITILEPEVFGQKLLAEVKACVKMQEMETPT